MPIEVWHTSGAVISYRDGFQSKDCCDGKLLVMPLTILLQANKGALLHLSSHHLRTQPEKLLTLQEKVASTANLNERILKEGIAADMCIVAGNRVHIKCHKAFLVAHSVVFSAKLETEAVTGILEMSEMTEQSVRAFLMYLYYSDVEDARINSEVAFEFIVAGHRYDIEDLERPWNRFS